MCSFFMYFFIYFLLKIYEKVGCYFYAHFPVWELHPKQHDADIAHEVPTGPQDSHNKASRRRLAPNLKTEMGIRTCAVRPAR